VSSNSVDGTFSGMWFENNGAGPKDLLVDLSAGTSENHVGAVLRFFHCSGPSGSITHVLGSDASSYATLIFEHCPLGDVVLSAKTPNCTITKCWVQSIAFNGATGTTFQLNTGSHSQQTLWQGKPTEDGYQLIGVEPETKYDYSLPPGDSIVQCRYDPGVTFAGILPLAAGTRISLFPMWHPFTFAHNSGGRTTGKPIYCPHNKTFTVGGRMSDTSYAPDARVDLRFDSIRDAWLVQDIVGAVSSTTTTAAAEATLELIRGLNTLTLPTPGAYTEMRGMKARVEGFEATLSWASGSIGFAHQDAGAAAADRISTSTGATVTVAPSTGGVAVVRARYVAEAWRLEVIEGVVS